MKTQSKIIPASLWIIVFILILGVADWQTGYEINFFVFYFLPVCIAAWLYGSGVSVFVSIVCAGVWAYADKLAGHSYSSTYFFVWNTLVRLTAFIAIGFSIRKIFLLLKAEKENSQQLKSALAELRVLESFLSICCVCKKIRNEDGQWQQLESYISTHSDTTFSHGYCPECAKKAFEDIGLPKK
jgi:hypothetical protein